MRHWLWKSVAVATMIATSGCATLLNGGESRVTVEVLDAPADTTVVVKGVNDGSEVVQHAARFELPLPRDNSFAVAASASGTEPTVGIVKSETNPYYFGNFAFAAAPLVLPLLMPYLAPGLRLDLASGTSLALAGELALLAALGVDLVTRNAWKHNVNTVQLRLVRKAPKP